MARLLSDATPLRARKPADLVAGKQSARTSGGARITSDKDQLSEVSASQPALLGEVLVEGYRAAAAAAEYARAARPYNTQRAYAGDWQDFATWCAGAGFATLPAVPETIAWYVAQLARRGLKASTIERRLAGIAVAHREAGNTSPTSHPAVRKVVGGIKRTHGALQEVKSPALVEDLQVMLAELPDTVAAVRDRALLLVGFAGAFRRTELVGIDLEHLEWKRDGVVVVLPRSKTDQEGHGRQVGLPYGKHVETCPVRALRAWLKAAGITRGPAFRPINRWGYVRPRRLSDRSVALIVQKRAQAAGLDAERYAGHSLRAGFVTAAARVKVPERDIMRQTGHKSIAMVRRYIRDAELFVDNPAAQVGL